MTRCLDDILRQPQELLKALEPMVDVPEMMRTFTGAAILHDAAHLYISGMGASWSAGMAAQALFAEGGRAAALVDASELMHQAEFRPDSAILLLSRSGKSVEIVALLDRAKEAGVKVVGVTNAPDSPLAKRADAAILLGVGFDHAVSVVTYTALALLGARVADLACGATRDSDLLDLRKTFRMLPAAIDGWRPLLNGNPWCEAKGPTYFLARRASLASAHEARLMWEEAAKLPATALTSGGFRHGPQEIVEPGMRVGLWIDATVRREEDFAMARDLRKLGVRVMTIGQNLPQGCGDLVFELPPVHAAYQFAIDVIPAQLAAEHVARLRGVDCDTFRLGSHVVTKEGGLL